MQDEEQKRLEALDRKVDELTRNLEALQATVKEMFQEVRALYEAEDFSQQA